MTRHDALDLVVDSGIVAILRADSGEQLAAVAERLFAAGIRAIEVTFTVPGVLDVIRDVRRRLGDRILLGAGTVLDAETARAAILAGAEFVVSPVVRPEIIALSHRYDKLVMPGAFTPTEVLTAWEAGADVVKVFPAEVGGPSYIKALRGPLPQIRMLPTGGVNLENIGQFFKAGAVAVGLGSALVPRDALRAGNLDRIAELASQYVARVREARKPS